MTSYSWLLSLPFECPFLLPAAPTPVPPNLLSTLPILGAPRCGLWRQPLPISSLASAYTMSRGGSHARSLHLCSGALWMGKQSPLFLLQLPTVQHRPNSSEKEPHDGRAARKPLSPLSFFPSGSQSFPATVWWANPVLTRLDRGRLEMWLCPAQAG